MNNRIEINNPSLYKYKINKSFLAGIVLKGHEVKSIRQGNINLKDSFIKLKNNELFLDKANIDQYKFDTIYEKKNILRDIKILLNKYEILKIKKFLETGHGRTIIPNKIQFIKKLIKIKISLVEKKILKNKKNKILQKISKQETYNII